MSLFRAILISLLVSGLMACCTITLGVSRRLEPRYKGVDPQVASYVNEWLNIAKEHGFKFDKIVTVGMMTIDRPSVVAQCNYGDKFREIDVDPTYWAQFKSITRMAMIFHELGHCYCDRSHDYVFGNHLKGYGNDESSRKDPKKKDGFFSDGCPISFMFPTVAEDSCTLSHYSEYVDELFKACEPY
jgi:hypothetical protein